MNDGTSVGDVPFRADFAARVVDQATRIVRRRRWLAVTSSMAAVAVLAAGLWDMRVSRNLPRRPSMPATQTASAAEFNWPVEMERPDPMQWMFPDARPVARFANRYFDSMLGGATRRQQMLFADDSDQGEWL